MIWRIIWMLISGAFVGWIASMIMGQNGSSTVRNIIVGVAGSSLGQFLFGLIGFYTFGFARLIVSVIGACVLLMIVNWLASR